MSSHHAVESRWFSPLCRNEAQLVSAVLTTVTEPVPYLTPAGQRTTQTRARLTSHPRVYHSATLPLRLMLFNPSGGDSRASNHAVHGPLSPILA